ncbi:hypothetical protein P170DRAFT_274089 [Aspergillus steynii IBT 23096]|uniref:Uncharacterized protein n=1 Tax=Aspergillus steynii IBT 23096 TaxID=1392250 RepID=A0A2I2FX30_9EURO|nr:uncharacterized protein P170DRAFT_274089 [Aspergillus steynii IBT 23096]PLB45163.1 hypothetical protein P170DRAFT_274089 [Aspergillus steynii IBT 23096]
MSVAGRMDTEDGVEPVDIMGIPYDFTIWDGTIPSSKRNFARSQAEILKRPGWSLVVLQNVSVSVGTWELELELGIGNAAQPQFGVHEAEGPIPYRIVTSGPSLFTALRMVRGTCLASTFCVYSGILLPSLYLLYLGILPTKALDRELPHGCQIPCKAERNQNQSTLRINRATCPLRPTAKCGTLEPPAAGMVLLLWRLSTGRVEWQAATGPSREPHAPPRLSSA